MFRGATGVRLLVVAVAVALMMSVTAAAEAQQEDPAPPDGSGGAQIVGGSEASKGEYPFLVALVSGSQGNSWLGQQCGGSVVGSKWILTAAHCVVDRDTGEVAAPSDLDVIIGRYDIYCHDFGSSGPPCTEGVRHELASVHPHPDYNLDTRSNDIAVLKLKTTTDAPPIQWATPGDAAFFKPGTTATVIGWGDTESTPQYPDVPHEVEVPILSDAGCVSPNTDYSSSSLVPGTMICAGNVASGGVDSCQGDSGGPLIVRKGGKWLQVGIVSFGAGCADARRPGIYAEVSTFVNFITFRVPVCNGKAVTIDMNTNGGNGNGTGGQNVILGTPSADTIRGRGGNDTICAGGGRDTVSGGPGNDVIFGEGGPDTINGGGGADTINGGPGADTIRGQGGPDTINGGDGADKIDGQGSPDTINGGAGADTINGQNGADTLSGGPGHDTLKGQTGPDVLNGNEHNDKLQGGNGNDTLVGGPGTDTCAGNTGGGDRAQASSCETRTGIESLF